MSLCGGWPVWLTKGSFSSQVGLSVVRKPREVHAPDKFQLASWPLSMWPHHCDRRLPATALDCWLCAGPNAVGAACCQHSSSPVVPGTGLVGTSEGKPSLAGDGLSHS